MALTNIELYEALKGSLSDEAARMIAEVVPPTSDLVTKRDLGVAIAEVRADVADLKTEVAVLKADVVVLKTDVAEIKSDIADVKVEMASIKGYVDSRLVRYTFAFFVPMWASMVGMFAVVLTKLD